MVSVNLTTAKHERRRRRRRRKRGVRANVGLKNPPTPHPNFPSSSSSSSTSLILLPVQAFFSSPSLRHIPSFPRLPLLFFGAKSFLLPFDKPQLSSLSDSFNLSPSDQLSSPPPPPPLWFWPNLRWFHCQSSRGEKTPQCKRQKRRQTCCYEWKEEFRNKQSNRNLVKLMKGTDAPGRDRRKWNMSVCLSSCE